MRRQLGRLAAIAILGVAAIFCGSGRSLAADARAAVAPLPFDHILRFDEMTRLLHDWASQRPDLVTLESLDKTPGGRDMNLALVDGLLSGLGVETAKTRLDPRPGECCVCIDVAPR